MDILPEVLVVRTSPVHPTRSRTSGDILRLVCSNEGIDCILLGRTYCTRSALRIQCDFFYNAYKKPKALEISVMLDGKKVIPREWKLEIQLD